MNDVYEVLDVLVSERRIVTSYLIRNPSRLLRTGDDVVIEWEDGARSKAYVSTCGFEYATVKTYLVEL